MTPAACHRPKPLCWEELRFCPGCGAPYPLPLESPRVCGSCGRALYPDPKLVACAVLRVEAGIVLVRRAFKDRGWMLPGGHVDQGEGVEAALLREITEETGLAAAITGLVGVFSHPGETMVVVAYTAQAHGAPKPQGETRSAAVFAPSAIPWQELAFRATAMALAAALGLPRPPALPMPAASPTLSVSKEHV
ncbi:MAG: NUDIX domain-containing protein [Desulfomicrobiaceae bacterium]